ncbi:MAG: Endoglucanase precursor [Pelotomaculum sp. PtaB.Bin104]|nr:MAG: Endoglucanase precursor [Pelotomaculum sp. PtaB.Bin104]
MLNKCKIKQLGTVLLLAVFFAVAVTGASAALGDPDYNGSVSALEPLLSKVAGLEPADAEKAVSLLVKLNSAFFTGINDNQSALNSDEKACLDQHYRITAAFIGNIFNNPSSGLKQYINSIPSGSEFGYNGFINAVRNGDALYLAGLIEHIWDKSILPETKGWLILSGIDFNDLFLILTAFTQVEYEPGLALTQSVSDQYNLILAGIIARSEGKLTPADLVACGLTATNIAEAVSQLSDQDKADLELILGKMNLIKPAAVALEPADGAVDVDLDAGVKATFDRDVVMGDLSGVKIEADGSVVEGVYATLNGREVTVEHPDFSEKEIYTVTLPAGAVKSAAGGASSLEYVWSFETVGLNGPEVESVEPADGATGVYLDAEVKATFDRDVIQGDLSGVKIELDGTVMEGVSASLDGRVLTVEHPDFDFSQTCTVILPAGAVESEADDTANEDYQWTFTTLSAPAPVMESVQPADGATGVALDADVSATFDRDVTAGDLEGVKIESEGSVLEGVYASLNGRVLTLSHPDFSVNKLYTVDLPAGTVKSADGDIDSAAYQWSFKTKGENDVNRPAVESVEPAAGANDVALDAAVTATFDRDVSEGDLTAVKVMVDGAVMDSVSAELDGRVLTVNHPGFNYEKTYTVIMPAGVVVSEDGGLATEAFQWSFSTGINPGPYALEVRTDKPAYAIGETVLVSGSFKEIADVRVPVAGVNIGLVLSSNGTLIAFGQAITNENGEFSYSFYTSGLAEGNYTVNATANTTNAQAYFSVSEGQASDKPQVSVYSPEIGAINVARDAVVSVTFNMDVTAVTEALENITIAKDGTSISNVSATLNGRVLTISHPQFERGRITYTVNIPAGVVKSTYGTYNDEINWTFTTVKEPSRGGGGNRNDDDDDECKFEDVRDSHWAAEVIKQMCKKGIVNGYPDGTFKPENNITRAEFAKIIVEAMKLDQENPSIPSFTDIKRGDWYYGYVEAAAKSDLVKGFETGEFRPNERINREQIAAVLVRALGKEAEARAHQDEETIFTDDQSISPWARGYINVAVQDEAALIVGYPDRTFKPLNKATRAEACTLISRFLAR